MKGHINAYIYLGFKHVADKIHCDDNGNDSENTEFQGTLKSLEICAEACRSSSQMFIYGTNKFGNNRCRWVQNKFGPKTDLCGTPF